MVVQPLANNNIFLMTDFRETQLGRYEIDLKSHSFLIEKIKFNRKVRFLDPLNGASNLYTITVK